MAWGAEWGHQDSNFRIEKRKGFLFVFVLKQAQCIIFVSFIENSFVGWGLQAWEDGGREGPADTAPNSERKIDLLSTPSRGCGFLLPAGVST